MGSRSRSEQAESSNSPQEAEVGNSKDNNNDSNDRKDTDKETGKGWPQILEQVKTPLTFFALALLIIEASLATIVSTGKLEPDRTFVAVVIMTFLFLVVVAIVALLTWFSPEKLTWTTVKKFVGEETRRLNEPTLEKFRKAVLLRELKDLRRDLSAFNEDARIRGLQPNKSYPNLQQDPFSTYVKPTIDGILKDPQLSTIVDQKTLARLDNLSTGEYTVRECLAQLDKIIEELH